MKKHFTLCMILLLFPMMAHAVKAPTAVGTYELQGVMETAGSLIVKPDHTYKAGFSYGAADWTEEGVWKQKGDDKELVVKSSECITFDVARLSPVVLKAVRGKQGKTIDVERKSKKPRGRFYPTQYSVIIRE